MGKLIKQNRESKNFMIYKPRNMSNKRLNKEILTLIAAALASMAVVLSMAIWLS